MVSFDNNNTSDLFDINFAKNYLVILSSEPEISKKSINKEDFRSGFTMVGFLNN